MFLAILAIVCFAPLLMSVRLATTYTPRSAPLHACFVPLPTALPATQVVSAPPAWPDTALTMDIAILHAPRIVLPLVVTSILAFVRHA